MGHFLGLWLLCCGPAAAEPTATTTPQRAWLGATLLRDEGRGLLVLEVEPASPALRAGLRPGDRLLDLDGARADYVPGLLLDFAPGDEVRLRIRRDRVERELRARLEAWPEGRQPPPLPVYRGWPERADRPSPHDRQVT